MSPADELDTLQLGPDPDKLELYHRQQLSAMLDGELPQDQARFLRRRLQHDAELSGCFERWQVCGDVLRGRQVSLLPADFAERIARGIAEDGVTVAPATPVRRPRLLQWGGGAALAASVALVALFVTRPGTLEGDGDPRPAPAFAAVGVDAPVSDASADASALAAAAPEAGLAVAGVALAAAERPRRATAEREANARQAVTRPQTVSQVAAASPQMASGASVLVDAAATLASAPASSGLPAVDGVARPWPRASMLSADSSFSVRYGETFPEPSWSERAPDSTVLPRFPVDPGDTAAGPAARVQP
ncbi:sigma-E factor negative regulatory protein [Luteimonas sp BLCC-B24]|uniref:sigma-E factor negative regulatory protein n=1 Tax=Luteimonas sp. BLCC-B24 TaxID=3025317 RepID=UPI00234DC5C0|nr:sigma-E factor negative regulatory protein [Luteimonas sp. BLCC-B24]MDC7808075.1 sigma-E factor negative regulatory protein [Luteimonas sp. BLCC-B24]